MAQQDVIWQTTDRPRTQVTLDRAYTLTGSMYSDGTIVDPTSATIDVKRPGGAALPSAVSGAAVTNTAGVLTYALSAANANLLASNYVAIWHVIASGVTYDFVQLFDVVRYPLRSNVIQADLEKHHKDLSDYLLTGESNAQVYIEQAFEDVYQWLDNKGNRPFLVLSVEDLRRPIEHLALEKIFRPKSKNEGDREDRRATYHRAEYERLIQSAALVYDLDQSGSADGTSAFGNEGEEGSQGLGMRWRI